MSLAGQCYLFEDMGSWHLNIFLTDYAGELQETIIVNVTSWHRKKDETCVVLPGEHSFITKKSIIFYKNATLLKERNAEYIITNGIHQNPISDALLNKICLGLCQSKETPPAVKEFYQKYHT